MNKVSRLLLTIAAPAVIGFATYPAQAAPVPVSISTFSFVPGSGYGIDASEHSATRLDVLFSSTFSTQNFVLDGIGDSRTFEVGTVQLREPNSAGGIDASETDHLDVAANLNFTSPLGLPIQLLATGTAITGAVSDVHTDLTIDWNPLQVSFGSGGLLDIALNDLTFSTSSQTLTQTATVTLSREPGLSAPAQVPEPGSLVLAGAALAGLAYVRRPRRS